MLSYETVDGVEEKNADIVTKVKLRHELGKANADIILNELNKIRIMFNMSSGDGYGHAFEIFSIAVLYNLDYEYTYHNYIVHGKNDGKIDAIYWNSDVVSLYQIKLDLVEVDVKEDIRKNYLEFLDCSNISSSNTEDLLAFCNKNKNNILRNKNFKIIIISNNIKGDEDITPKSICDKFIEDHILCKDNNIRLELYVPKVKSSDAKDIISLSKSSSNVFAYFSSAKKFIDQLLACDSIGCKENLYKFFYDNVRGNLGINSNMQRTIEEEPNNFVKFNNGITITGDVDYKDLVGTLIINNPIISNGQQTIWNLANKYPDIDNIDLLIIVKNDSDSVIKSKIARYTNEQKLIKPIDLLSLDENIRSLQRKIYELTRSSRDVFLEINTSGQKNYTSIIKRIYDKNSIISLVEFCKLYFSTEDLRLGNWKSNISAMINSLLNKTVVYDYEKALLICNIIKKFKSYISNIDDKKIKNNLKAGDLAFMFIMYKYDLDEIGAHKIIDKINNKYFFDISVESRKSKLIDLYKSNDIYDKIVDIIGNK